MHATLAAFVDERETQKAKAGSRRSGAEFIMVDVDLAFTFLEVARTSTVPGTAKRNQKNARRAYDSILQLLPRSIATFSVPEQMALHRKLEELKSRLKYLGESFDSSS
jgi:hypothetical protein